MKRIQYSIQSMIILFFVVISLFAIGNFLAISFYEYQQADDTALVDASGRNRMLSQKIGFYAGMVVSGREEMRSSLGEAILLHEKTLNSLRDGGVVPGIAGNRALPPVPESVHGKLLAVEELWLDFSTKARKIHGNFGSAEEQAKALRFLQDNAGLQLKLNNDLVQALVKENQGKQQRLDRLLIGLLVVNLLLALGAFLLFRRKVIQPLQSMATTSEEVANGTFKEKLVGSADPNMNRIVEAINTLGGQLDRSAAFAESIGKGEFDQNFGGGEQENKLFRELVRMRDRLMTVAEEDQKRNWTTEGLASFGETLRGNQDDMVRWSQQIVKQLVTYLGANQGGMFVVQDLDETEPILELTACYAWDRTKHLKKQIHKGEGLVGQCWMERKPTYMTDIPEDYVSIRSGLGAGSPRAIFILPLIRDEEVLGVIELASFKPFEPHQQEFVHQIAENIASTLASIRINARTRSLLSQSQEQSEALQSQEEELRQNMEEMQATQEEMARRQAHMDSTMRALNASLTLVEMDLEGKIISANDQFLNALGMRGDEVEGKNYKTLLTGEKWANGAFGHFLSTVNREEVRTLTGQRVGARGKQIDLLANYTPVIDGNGNKVRIMELGLIRNEKGEMLHGN